MNDLITIVAAEKLIQLSSDLYISGHCLKEFVDLDLVHIESQELIDLSLRVMDAVLELPIERELIRALIQQCHKTNVVNVDAKMNSWGVDAQAN